MYISLLYLTKDTFVIFITNNGEWPAHRRHLGSIFEIYIDVTDKIKRRRLLQIANSHGGTDYLGMYGPMEIIWE